MVPDCKYCVAEFFSFNSISSSSLHVSAHADIHIEKVLQKDVGQIVITSRGERDLRDGWWKGTFILFCLLQEWIHVLFVQLIIHLYLKMNSERLIYSASPFWHTDIFCFCFPWIHFFTPLLLSAYYTTWHGVRHWGYYEKLKYDFLLFAALNLCRRITGQSLPQSKKINIQ